MVVVVHTLAAHRQVAPGLLDKDLMVVLDLQLPEINVDQAVAVVRAALEQIVHKLKPAPAVSAYSLVSAELLHITQGVVAAVLINQPDL